MSVLSAVTQKMTTEQVTRFQELDKMHEAERQRIIAQEGEIDPYKEYPELDRLASEMFYLLSGGKEVIEISMEVIIANAE